MSRVDDLIAQMTLAEKLGQMTMTAADFAVTGPGGVADASAAIRAGATGGLLNIFGAERVRAAQRLAVEESRLGVPLLIGLDVIHGHRTMFPAPLAEACAFDPELWQATARAAAQEAAADGIALTFAPMLDVSRDPRWGRTVEGAGEDPFVAACVARAKVRGFQSSDMTSAQALAATAKHFCGYGAVAAGREYASGDLSERTLREVHMPSFAAAVAAGVAAVMPAFIDLAGVPLTADAALLQGELREKLGFEGLVVSDYNAIAELVRHGVAADLVDAAVLALRAGVDVDMMSGAYRDGLPIALAQGRVDLAEIDLAVRRALVLKERLGLFDDPYRRGATPEGRGATASRRALARRAAVRSMVLLKNDGGVLPLAASLGSLAVIGPLADAGPEMRGPWFAAADDNGHCPPLEGLREAFPQAEIRHARGVSLLGDSLDDVADAVAAAESCDATVLCLGEAAAMSGEAGSRAFLGLPGRQQALADAVLAATARRGAPTVVVLFSGRPLVAPDLFDRAAAVVAAWFPGSEAGRALGDILSGRASPGGRTVVTWPRAVGQIPIFYAERPSGRPADPADRLTSRYLDTPNSPQFPFGHGLTYGRFTLSGLRVAPAVARADTIVEATVDVVNEGLSQAEETVFCFIRDPVASVARPVLELKGFCKIALAPGERGCARINLAASSFAFLGRDLAPVFESGDLEILVGPCADRSRLLSTTIRLTSSRENERAAP